VVKEQLNARLDYQVVKANRNQIDFIFDNFCKNEKLRNVVIGFTAVDSLGDILGYLLIGEKEVPLPLNGADWWVHRLFIRDDFRRRGIASAILKEAIKHAGQSNIRHITGSANPTLRAQSFWFKHGFSGSRYGKIQDDPAYPLVCGNYHRMISRRVGDAAEVNEKPRSGYRISETGGERLDSTFDKLLDRSMTFYSDKRAGLFGLTAIDDDGNILGDIALLSDELAAPLDGEQWHIPYIFVNPEHRRMGIATNLLRETIRRAREARVSQMFCAQNTSDAEIIGFWDANRFAIFHWSHVGPNTRVDAALHVESSNILC
jgi:GNAT superfamily N-acetyltransferase